MNEPSGDRDLDLLVVVKAYPTATEFGEAVCVAAIDTTTEVPEWVRLFPIEFRDLPWEQRFKKYQRIKLVASRGVDSRPESWVPDADTLEIGEYLSAADGWRRRRAALERLRVYTMCELQRAQASDGTSLGMVITDGVPDLTREERPADEIAAKQRELAQARIALGSSAHSKLSALEQFPYRVKYKWSCGATCGGHEQSIIDWELVQAWRSWRSKYNESELWDKIEEKWVRQMFASGRRTYLYCGNMARYQASFLVLGVFWPPAA